MTIRLLGASWVDPDTPSESQTTKALFLDDVRKYELVFSDEFEQDGRNFKDGNDPRWTAIRKNDCEYKEIIFFGIQVVVFSLYFF